MNALSAETAHLAAIRFGVSRSKSGTTASAAGVDGFVRR
jgi:hypothetical protein